MASHASPSEIRDKLKQPVFPLRLMKNEGHIEAQCAPGSCTDD